MSGLRRWMREIAKRRGGGEGEGGERPQGEVRRIALSQDGIELVRPHIPHPREPTRAFLWSALFCPLTLHRSCPVGNSPKEPQGSPAKSGAGPEKERKKPKRLGKTGEQGPTRANGVPCRPSMARLVLGNCGLCGLWPVDRPVFCSGPRPPDRNEKAAAACPNGTPRPSASSTRDDESLLGMDTIQANIGQDFHARMHTGKETHKSRNRQVHFCISLSKEVPHVAVIQQPGSCASPLFRASKGHLNCVASSTAHQAQATSPHQSTDGTRHPKLATIRFSPLTD
ncbi:hypothetical protein BGZ61DRAFT_520309 [Ilyonectria robusta]|uniref:uncharacterized protein n=1 Tax=Ilyonectria robusta TaxID=1079257 RepID=UPI001E8EAFB9|nr:uncharacterized protein BGZ61DRAFT_520309 [Ilyonectria robusta]KAH8679178.1 hypothetical protein BGZ61DRAFT_520309 [Ilyonectria robusta]